MTRYFRQYTVSELNKFQDNVASYTCVCEAGLTGANCDQNINDCDPNSCNSIHLRSGIFFSGFCKIYH